MNDRLHSWLEKKKVSVSKYWRFQLVLRSLNRWSVNGESRTPYSEIKVPQISRETSGVPFMLSLLQCESFGKPEQGSCGIIPSSSAMVFRSAKRRERIPKIIFLENCLVLNPSPRCTLRHYCSGIWVSSSSRAQEKKLFDWNLHAEEASLSDHPGATVTVTFAPPELGLKPLDGYTPHTHIQTRIPHQFNPKVHITKSHMSRSLK